MTVPTIDNAGSHHHAVPWGLTLSLLATASVLACLALLGGRAEAAISLCTPEGAAAGECADPRGVATNTEAGQVYVAERDNDRVSVFDEEGTFLFAFGWGVDTGAEALETCTAASGCQAGIGGSGAGQLANPTNIAVDNVEGSGAVYVTTSDFRWNRFEEDEGDGSWDFVRAVGWGVLDGSEEVQICTTASECEPGIKGGGECQMSDANVGWVDPVAVGPSGNVYVADASGGAPNFTNRVQEFSPAGECLGETTLFEGSQRMNNSLVVDSAKDAYVSMSIVGGGSFRKFDLSADEIQLCVDPEIGNTNALAIDPESDRVFASQREPRDLTAGIFQTITEYDAACEPVRRFGYGQIGSNLLGLAYHPSAAGDLFASEGVGAVRYLPIPDPGPIIAPQSLQAAPQAVKATLTAEANPEGKATQLHVEYVTEEEFEESGFAEAEESEAEPIGEGVGLKGAEFEIGCDDPEAELEACLAPETTYRWRAVATNADNPEGEAEGTAEGPPFTTAAHIEGLWAAGVGTDTARLSALVNPQGIATTGYFEYVAQGSYEESGFAEATKAPDPESEAPLDFGSGAEAQTRTATLFPLPEGATFRYRLVVSDIFGEAVSEERSFTTFEAEPTSGPCPNEAVREGPAAFLPDCRGYEMVSPLDKAGGEVFVLPEASTKRPATLDQASASGSKLAYGSYRAYGDAKAAPYTSQYIARRTGSGWQGHGISPPYEEPIGDGAVFDNEYRAFSEDLCEGWLTPFGEPPLAEGAIPGYFNVYRRTDELCGGAPDFEAITTAKPENVEGPDYRIEVQGRSADGEVTAFLANDSLEGTEAPDNTSGKRQLYAKQGDGPVAFVCILPGGAPSPAACSAGVNIGVPLGDGRQSQVEGAVAADGRRIFWTNANKDGRIYVRENPFGEGAECGGGGAPCTVAVSVKGEEESGTSASHYWGAAADGSRAFYTTGKLESGTADLYGFEVDSQATTAIAGEVFGVMGASEDASRIYFISREAIVGAGENSEGEEAVDGDPNLYLHEEGGGYAFIGTVSAVDAGPGGGGKEHSSAVGVDPVHRNGRVTSDGSHAAFMSTAPLTGYDNTDASSGQADREVFVYDATSRQLRCASCNPSGGRPAGRNMGGEANPFWIAARLPAHENNLYAPRVLSSDGSRLFFEAADALSPRDGNGRIDVYQWEEAGRGGCTTGKTTYSAAAGGCIDLISSGKGTVDASFVDASPSGEDVFFTTEVSLFATDYGLVDIYDARVGGGFEPPPPPAPECEGEGCQSPSPPPAFTDPSSRAFAGPGNLPAAARPGPAARCNRSARRARRHSRRAKAKRRAARRAARKGNRRAARRSARQARRSARSARRLSRGAKRCRARARRTTSPGKQSAKGATK